MADMLIREVWNVDESCEIDVNCNIIHVISPDGLDLRTTISKLAGTLEDALEGVDNPLRKEIFQGDLQQKFTQEYLRGCAENHGINLDTILDLLLSARIINDYSYLSFETFNTSNNDFE